MTVDQSSASPLPEHTHPYVVHLPLKLGSNIELELNDDETRLPFAKNYTLKISKRHTPPHEQVNAIKRITVQLEAFPTASDAERAGKQLVLSILWFAASRRITIAFDRWTGGFPFSVRDRTQATGLTAHAELTVFSKVKLEELIATAEQAFMPGRDIAPNILISMTFCASARMETTERARFIGLMTALEALSVQEDYGDEIAELLGNLASQLENSSELAGEDRAAVRLSLVGRLRGLRRESVRRAILREMDRLKDEKTTAWLDEVYGKRSDLLHEGSEIPDLPAITHRLEDVIRQIYALTLNLPLDQPPHPG